MEQLATSCLMLLFLRNKSMRQEHETKGEMVPLFRRAVKLIITCPPFNSGARLTLSVFYDVMLLCPPCFPRISWGHFSRREKSYCSRCSLVFCLCCKATNGNISFRPTGGRFLRNNWQQLAILLFLAFPRRGNGEMGSFGTIAIVLRNPDRRKTA